MAHRRLLGVAIACCLTLVSACTPVTDMVKIHYRQSANLQEFDIPQTQACQSAITLNGGSRIVTGGFWVIYEITSIENRDQKPLQFNFQLSKLNVQTGGQKYYPGFVGTCLQTAQDTVVAPGASWPYLGRFLINVQSAWGSAGDHNSELNLFYDGPLGQPVVFTRETGIRPSPAGFSGQPAGLPIFETYATDELMGLILQCTGQLSPPSGCVTE